jgi:UDP-N-acetylglucosamine 3-dehydrogenase
MKLRVGVIGCGKIAQIRHLPEYLLLDDVEIIALCDMNLERANKVAEQYDIRNVYQDYHKLVDRTDIDVVSICTPNTTHAEVAKYALNNGKHVFIEKPMATSIEDCEKIVDAAEHSGTICMIGHNQRFNPIHQRVKEIISSGCIGKVYQFSTNYHHGGPEHWSLDGAKSWFFNREEAGFGVIGDLGIHKIDLVQWLLDDSVGELKAYYSTFQKEGNVEDNAVLVTRMCRGAIGTVNVSWNNPLQDHRTVLYGEKGVLTFGESLFGFRVEFYDGGNLEDEVVPQVRPDGLMLSGAIEHFVSCVRNGETPIITAREAMHSIRMLTEAIDNRV